MPGKTIPQSPCNQAFVPLMDIGEGHPTGAGLPRNVRRRGLAPRARTCKADSGEAALVASAGYGDRKSRRSLAMQRVSICVAMDSNPTRSTQQYVLTFTLE